MSNIEYLEQLVRERLEGDRSRIGELFADESVFQQLQAMARTSDWYHFEPKTYDGQYLVRSFAGYEVYEQERGTKSNSRTFSTLSEAVIEFFNER
jgi:hypothetical protein